MTYHTTNLWELLEKEPYNHYFWTELVRVAEDSKNFEGIAKVYRGFLEKFPLLHIYWNKLAIFLYENGPNNSVKDSIEVFEQSVKQGVLYHSAEMWQCYCTFATESCNIELGQDGVRNILERAVTAVGGDYQSDTIWSTYIQWENNNHNFDNVSALYMRVLSQPVRHLETFLENLFEHAKICSIEKAATPIERAQIDDQVNKEAENDIIKAADIGPRMTTLILEKRQQSYLQTAEAINKRQYFENKIRRTYFHFTRPNPIQIANWYQYIEFETISGDVQRTQHLYERCLIPCQMCPNIWINYATFLYSVGKVAEAEELLEQRAFNGLVGMDVEFLRLYGMFEESRENLQKASIIFEKINDEMTKPNGRFFNSGSARIALSSYYLRHTELQDRAIPVLVDFLNRYGKTLPESDGRHPLKRNQNKYDNSPDQREYVVVTAALSQLMSLETFEANYIAELRQKCLKVPLALAICVKTMVQNNRIEQAKQIYDEFLNSPKSQMTLADKEDIFPQYIEFLRKNATLTEIRQAERQYLQVQKAHRKEIMDERREKSKDTTNLSEIMDRWILYLQEIELFRRGYQEAND